MESQGIPNSQKNPERELLKDSFFLTSKLTTKLQQSKQWDTALRTTRPMDRRESPERNSCILLNDSQQGHKEHSGEGADSLFNNVWKVGPSHAKESIIIPHTNINSEMDQRPK